MVGSALKPAVESSFTSFVTSRRVFKKMLSEGLDRFLDPKWLLVIRLVQWLGWVFENREGKKERKKVGHESVHWDTLSTLRKDLDDADSLTYHQSKLEHETTFSNHKRKNSRTKYWPTLYATIEMTDYMHDKILEPCGIISENTKTITLRILYRLKLAPTHLLMPESEKAYLLLGPILGTYSDRGF